MSIKKLSIGILIILFSIALYFLEFYLLKYHDEYQNCIEYELEYPVKCSNNTTFEEYEYYYSFSNYLKDKAFNWESIKISIALNLGLISLAILMIFYQDKRNLNLRNNSYIIIWSIISIIIGIIPLLIWEIRSLNIIFQNNYNLASGINIFLKEALAILCYIILGISFIINGIIKIRYIKYVKNDL